MTKPGKGVKGTVEYRSPLAGEDMPRKPLEALAGRLTLRAVGGVGLFNPTHCHTASAGSGAEPQGSETVILSAIFARICTASNTELHERDCASLSFVDQRYFDATLEVGIPTVYAVRRLSPPLGRDVIVSCACHPDVAQALFKARLEASSQQLMRLNESTGVPYSRYKHEDGYLVKDHQETRPDLSFLDSGSKLPKSLSELSETAAHHGTGNAVSVFASVAKRYPEIIIVDIATDELRELGVHVVKAIVPGLMPTAPSNHKFTHHPRLGEVARFFGLPVRTADDLNMKPQPFC